MMKKKFSTSATKVLLVVSLACTSLYAFSGGFEHDHRGNKSSVMHNEKSDRFMKHKLKKMAKYLDLTKDQRQQAKAIRLQGKESHVALKESLQDFHQQSKVLIMADSFDEQAFTELQSQYQHNFAEMALIKAKNKHSFMQLLTEEQKEKMKSFNFGLERTRKFSE